MNRLRSHIIGGLVLLCTSLAFAACDQNTDDPTPPATGDSISTATETQTVLIYMAAQSSRGYNGYRLQDSTEIMEGAPYLRDGQRVLLFMDDENPPRLYEVARGYARPRLVKKWEEDLNSADPNTLTALLTIMKEQFTADHYGLVLWSHADGWLPGARNYRDAHRTPSNRLSSANGKTTKNTIRSFRPLSYGMDVGKNGNMARDKAALGDFPYEMNVEDIAKAVERSGIHLRFIHNDCCEMQCIEVAYALRHVTDYVAGSPMQISAIGGFYTDMLRSGYFSQDIADLGKTYVDYYLGKGSKPYYENFGVVFSILRTADLQAVADSMAKVLPRNLPALTAQGTPNYPNTDQVQPYSRYSSYFFYRPEFFDMSDALRNMLSAQDFAKVQTALQRATVYKATTKRFFTGMGIGRQYWINGGWRNTLDYNDVIYVDADKFCGVSMFVPQQRYADNAARCPQGNLNITFRDTEWYRAAGWQAAGW